MEKKKRGRPPKITGRPCPFDKQPCPMTFTGCAAWKEWRIYQPTTQKVTGCTQFGVLAHDMILEATKDE